MIAQPQWAQVGARAWIAHSKLSNTCDRPAMTTSNALSYSFPQTSHWAIPLPPFRLLEEMQQQQYHDGIIGRTRDLDANFITIHEHPWPVLLVRVSMESQGDGSHGKSP